MYVYSGSSLQYVLHSVLYRASSDVAMFNTPDRQGSVDAEVNIWGQVWLNLALYSAKNNQSMMSLINL